MEKNRRLVITCEGEGPPLTGILERVSRLKEKRTKGEAGGEGWKDLGVYFKSGKNSV